MRRERELRGALAAAQAELLQAERLAAIGEMTVTLHHEINNPLMAASAEVELLLARGDGLSDDQKAALGEIRVALDRIRDIVRKIGNLREAKTTPYSGELKMIDLSE